MYNVICKQCNLKFSSNSPAKNQTCSNCKEQIYQKAFLESNGKCMICEKEISEKRLREGKVTCPSFSCMAKYTQLYKYFEI